jgi:hypothetical protein
MKRLSIFVTAPMTAKAPIAGNGQQLCVELR